jgi:hypothetical protein
MLSHGKKGAMQRKGRGGKVLCIYLPTSSPYFHKRDQLLVALSSLLLLFNIHKQTKLLLLNAAMAETNPITFALNGDAKYHLLVIPTRYSGLSLSFTQDIMAI